MLIPTRIMEKKNESKAFLGKGEIMKTRIISGMMLLALSGFSAVASATYILIPELGGQAVYDHATNLTWVANANLADTNTFGVSGINAGGYMTWSIAQQWIAAMDTANYLGYSDWRLPTSDTCVGYNCTGSEMGNLFYNGLGQVAGQSITATNNAANYGLFQNVQSGLYWSGTEYAPNPNDAWNFLTYNGSQNAYSKSTIIFALAVRSGQVAAVPEPSTALMLGVGLLALIGVGRRRLALR